MKTSKYRTQTPPAIRKKGFMGQRSKIVQLSGIGYFEALDQSGRHAWTRVPSIL